MALRTLISLAAIFTVACAAVSCSGGKTVSISADARDSDASYTLLYSTLGYESGGTKHAYIRQDDIHAPVSEGQQFVWRLVDSSGHQATAGRAAYTGTAWGIPLWTIDFSKIDDTGQYRLVVEGPDMHLSSQAFAIDRFLVWRRTFAALGFDESEARAAPIELDEGYYDSNRRTGEATAHADYMYGLLEAYDQRSAVLTEGERQGLRDAIDRAADYLILIGDPGTGQLTAEADSRPFNRVDPSSTAAGARALAHFAIVMKREDPAKAERAFRRAQQGDQWLRENAILAYPSWSRAEVEFDLYKYAVDAASLDRAASAIREEAKSYDLRSMDRDSRDAMPHFEAMYRMWRELPSHADQALWVETAKGVAAQYKEVLGRNVFQVIPPGTTDAARGTDAAAQWDHADTEPPPGDNGSDAAISNGWFIARAIDASYLAEMANDKELEKIAAASMQWVLGLNPGVPSERVSGANPQSPVAAASFLTGVGLREAQGASSWEWLRTKPFGTIVSGFRSGFTYEDSLAAADSSLRYDGAWISATLAYEDYLNRGKRPPEPSPVARRDSGASVVSVKPSPSSEILQAVVAVAGPDGRPLGGAIVAGAWAGKLLPDHAPHESLQVNECVTGPNGSCVLVLDPQVLAVSMPITLTVTNVQHLFYAYVLPADASSVTATFP